MAGRWRALRITVAITLGTVGVVISALVADTTDYVAAAAGLWLLLSRAILSVRERVEQDRGALAQEVFDTTVLQLPWSPASCGTPPAPEDIRCWAEKEPEEGLRGWYPDIAEARPPLDAVLCQRSSVTWARQDHAAYATLLRWIVGLAFTATIVGGVVFDLSLGGYLLHLGLPALPAAIELLDMANLNADLSRRRGRIEHETDALIDRAAAQSQLPSVREVRQVQDAVFAARRVARVPGWFYKLTRDRRERNMREAAALLIARLPDSARIESP